ncbi:sodium/nucleoside cotransporter [Elysia marginata]|uniref:Sodium/nucleoside cotransporter n=1 Tax=Elysia marginata TaxID=1093978 RepID=A0AAV4GVV4_9GAST|nr:sodium/nucleoside cotransporter [Elysia marginata]
MVDVFSRMVSVPNGTVDKQDDHKDPNDVVCSGPDKDVTTSEFHDGVIVHVATDEEDCEHHLGPCSRKLDSIEQVTRDFLNRNRDQIFLCLKVLLLLGYMAYYICCVCHKFGDEGSLVLTVITVFLLIKIVVSYTPKRTSCSCTFTSWITAGEKLKRTRKCIRIFLYIIALLGVCIYIGVDVIRHDPSNLQALSGVVVLIFGCFVFSSRPSRVNWHPVFWGFIIQIVMAIITLRTTPGYRAFKWIGDMVEEFVRLSDKGSNFVLGASFRATGPGFFFETAGVMVFFNSCIFVLDYFGILESIILSIGGGLALCLETGPIESVVAAANIFIGLSEAPLLVRPYLPVITRSELHAIMTCGFASISGAFMAMFIKAGVRYM